MIRSVFDILENCIYNIKFFFYFFPLFYTKINIIYIVYLDRANTDCILIRMNIDIINKINIMLKFGSDSRLDI